MTEGVVRGMGLAEAICQIKADLAEAQTTPTGKEMRLPVKSVTVELKVVATTSADTRAGFKVPFVDLELGGSAALSAEHTHTITVVFDTPIDEYGDPVKVGKFDDEPSF